MSGVRASVLGGGTACGLKQRWKDGTTHVVMTKEVLMERLCALVPKPRKHLVTYHGVLAPAAGLRSQVVPKRVEEERKGERCNHGTAGGAAAVPARWRRTARRRRSVVGNCSVGCANDYANDCAKGCAFRMVVGSGLAGRRRYPRASLLMRV